MGVREVVERDADRVFVQLRGEDDASSVDVLSQILARAMTLDDLNLLVAGTVDAAPVSTTQGALGTWVAAPATDRGDRAGDAPKPTPGSALNVAGRGSA